MSTGSTIKQSAFPKLENLLCKAIKRISTDSGTLTGQQIIFENLHFDIITLDSFLSKNDTNYMLVKAEVEEGYKGYLYMLFPAKDAITLGGLLLAIDEQEIREKTKADTLDVETTDAFNEFGNQICGMLDGAFRQNLPRPIHITQSQTTPFTPQTAGEFPPELLTDEYIVLTSDMLISDFDIGKFSMFIPITLGEAFYEETIEIQNEDEAMDYIGVILVVSTTIAEVKSVRKQLNKMQYKVLTSKNGITTMVTLLKERVNLILIDMELSNDDGISVCKRIRGNLLTEEIPIVMCSSSPTRQQVIDSITAGVQDFIVKPVNEDKLHEKVEKNIQKRPSKDLFVGQYNLAERG